jgi:hypothetical protein
VNNRVSLCLNGEDCDKKKEPPRPEPTDPPVTTQEAVEEEGEDETDPPTPTPAETLTQKCVNWARAGECDKNPAYMLQKCGPQCDAWCDASLDDGHKVNPTADWWATCDSRIAHWKECLAYAKGAACYTNQGYMKSFCSAFCPKHTTPPKGFDKHGQAS